MGFNKPQGNGGGGLPSGLDYSSHILTIGDGTGASESITFDTSAAGTAYLRDEAGNNFFRRTAADLCQFGTGDASRPAIDISTAEDSGEVGEYRVNGVVLMSYDVDSDRVQIGSDNEARDALYLYHSVRGVEDIRTGTWRLVASVSRDENQQAIPTITTTALTWTDEDYDEGARVNLGTNADRILAVAAGTYKARLRGQIEAPGALEVYAVISHRNSGGTEIGRSPVRSHGLSGAPNVGTGYLDFDNEAIFFGVAATDYFVCQVYHAQGGDLDFGALTSALSYPQFSLEKLQ